MAINRNFDITSTPRFHLFLIVFCCTFIYGDFQTESPKQCHFCADTMAKCNKKLKRTEKIDCRNFKINGTHFNKYPVYPKFWQNETVLYHDELTKHGATLCLKIVFRGKKIEEEVTDSDDYYQYEDDYENKKDDKKDEEDNKDEIYTLRTCIHNEMFNGTPCHEINTTILSEQEMTMVECCTCNRDNCNSTNPTSVTTSIFTILLIIALVIK